METVSLSLNVAPSRRTVNGREYLVAPATLIVPGVLNGSKGSLYYPSEEIGKDPLAWNGMPIVAYHPQVNGQHVSGRDPEVFATQGLGHVYKTVANGKLGAQLWFDVEAVRNFDKKLPNSNKMLPRLEAGQPIELSTGLYTDNEQKPGTYKGRNYDAVARNYRPDHLAVLPDQKGACSNDDGCGVNVNANPAGVNQYSKSAGEARETSGKAYDAGLKAIRSGDPDDHRKAVDLHTEAAGLQKSLVEQAPRRAASEHVKMADHHISSAAKHGKMLIDNAAPNQPRHMDSGKYLPNGAGTGSGDVHDAVLAGGSWKCPECGGELDDAGDCEDCDEPSANGGPGSGPHPNHAALVDHYNKSSFDMAPAEAKAKAVELTEGMKKEHLSEALRGMGQTPSGSGKAMRDRVVGMSGENAATGVTSRGIDKMFTKNMLDTLETVYNRDWSQKKRDKLPPDDFAGPDQSFPIKDQDDIDAASHLVGKAADPDAVKAKVKAIAKRKGLEVPDSWKEPTENEWSDAARVAAIAARQASKGAKAATEKTGNKVAGFRAYSADKSAGMRDNQQAAANHAYTAMAHDEKGEHEAAAAHRGAQAMHERVAGMTNNQGTVMNRQQQIKYLVTNCNCWKGKEQLLASNAFSDTDVSELVTNSLVVNDGHSLEGASAEERGAAFSHMAKDAGSGHANKMSKVAEKKGTKTAHKRAESAHLAAADEHKDRAGTAKEEGDKEGASMHSKAAAFHEKKADAHLNAMKAPTGNAADNDMDDDDDAETGDDDPDSDTGETAPTKNRRQTMTQLLRHATPEDRSVWNTAVEIERKERHRLIGLLVANVAPDRRNVMAKKFGGKPLPELRELLQLIPTSNQQQEPDALPDYSGAAGGGRFQLTDNEQAEVLDLEALRATYNAEDKKQTASA